MSNENEVNRAWVAGLFEQLNSPDYEIAAAEASARATELVVICHYLYRRIDELEGRREPDGPQ